MTVNADCRFCGAACFASRALFIHPYSAEETELISKIDKKKLAALRKEHDDWLIACYKCLAEKCSVEDEPVEPRGPDTISIQEP